MSDHKQGAAKLADLAKDIKIAMFTTTDDEGHYVSRPMAAQHVEDDSDLWFFAERTSSVVTHIASRPHVGITLSSRDTWISIDGEAYVVDDPAKAKSLWNSWVEAWLPQGPEDPNVVLIKVEGHTGEYWDTPGGAVASVLSFVKAKTTGQRYQGGENETVQL
ncbi:MAG: Pyridoxamine 5'-phosphate oxidase-related, FMN-binding [uncultured Friedmanniella sp.]|uniref:Pyridoxamine 5'-phosphate oxidase-related, FMN-binding n=1 Tax=uncultured Friedmanniella sp. TaxID=335381 RepID=A0A6J4L4F8_9ACTN|nr:pyridoxamine 5'-phosphate oxidase family protein [uncultured Friedmanniella sp.]CAA9323661.1 MAG: Pyridoxamine 5'-phosphate oxidase-related, FMN-binding [uncultured Friedmanniella sp.]